MGRARGQNAIMALGAEATYGTPAAAGAYLRMPFVSTNLGAERSLIESDLLGQGRAPADPTYDVVTNDGDVVVPLDNTAFPHWLRLLFGPPATTGADGAFVHRFASGAPALPSAAIEIGHPDRPAYSTHYGLRANTLQINMQRSGLTSATIGLIGKGETVPGLTSNAGILAGLPENLRYAAASGSVLIDGVAVGEVVSAQISYSNQLEKDETIRPDGEINDVDPGMPSASVTLTTKFADLSLYSKATAGTPVSIDLAWNRGGARSMGVELPRLFLPRVKRPISGPGGVMAEFRSVASSFDGEVIIFNVANAMASYA